MALRYLSILICCGFILVGCRNEPTSQNSQAPVEKPLPGSVYFRCDVLTDEDSGQPMSQVFLVMGQQATKVADIAACDSIPQASWEQYTIPENALAACGGWWAGAGDYLYAVRDGNTIKIMKGWQDEGQQDEGFHYAEELRITIP